MQDNTKITEMETEGGELDAARAVRADFAARSLVGDKAPGYYIQTLGCQQNEADSERLAGLAELMGYRRVCDPNDARLILVNTCAIREHAEARALSFIGEYKHVREEHPDTVIGVGGCMVTQRHRADKLKMSYPYVNFTFDTGALHKLPFLVKQAIEKGSRRFVISDEYDIVEGLPVSRTSKHSAWLPIMYGCNNFCSYCIVPYVRGRERSRREEDILNEAKELIADGAREITLLGQNVNSYGNDSEDSSNIAELMRKICALDGDFRLRFMTSHPKDASDELLRAVAEEEKIVKHFHLPVQSGSDDVLRRMNRKYTSGHYLGIVEKLRALCPDISLTTDIIVGFPGETEEDFEATLELLRRVRYDMIFSFIYSPRKGTPAAEMEGAVPAEVSKERFARLTTLQDEISRERNERFIGRKVRLLAGEVSKNDSNMLTGRGDMARPVHFAGDASLVGSFVNVKITSCGAYNLEGELV